MENIVSIADFNLHVEDYNEELEAYKIEKIKVATNIIERYLGYSLDKTTYTEILHGDKIYLKAKPVISITSLVIDDVIVEEWQIVDNEVIVNSDLINKRSKIIITYTAGYETAAEVPLILREGVKRKAAEIWKDRGSNADNSNISSPDGVTRTIIWPARNKDLALLSQYRIIRYAHI